MTQNRYIVVNATALDRSGALSILKQFIENIPSDKYQWLIFTPDNVDLSSDKENVRLEPIPGVKPMLKRLFWDAFGLNKWLKKHDIIPIAAISLQNTGFRVTNKIPRFIYYHQPLPFYPNEWNPLDPIQRTFWFYKNIYPFFVRLFMNNETEIFVQLEFIKKGFISKFHHPKDKVSVFTPTVNSLFPENSDAGVTEKMTLIYPAMPHFYKNHKVIEEALKNTSRDVEIVFTIPTDDDRISDKRISKVGMQPQENIWKMYRSCDALLFPSYIETFGLPLLEAAMTGMPIIAADLPYAREVLDGYDGVTYVEYDNSIAWANAINKLKKGERFTPVDISSRPSWPELFSAIVKEIDS